MTNRILLFKIGALGDTLMTTPLIRQLRSYFKNAQIDYLVGKSASKVLEGNPNINNIIKFDENIFHKKCIFQYIKLVERIRSKRYNI